jgi:Carboxypeptidase regulatory-like domain
MFRRELSLLVCLLAAACSTSDIKLGGTGGGNGHGGGNGSNEHCSNLVDDDGDNLTDCADDDCLMAPSCFNNCVDTCTDGAAICDVSGVRTCQLQNTGCRAFGQPVSCNNGLVCSGGACLASCVDQCTQGAKQCSSTGGVVDCQKVAAGCTDWVGPTPCNAGDVCSGGSCVPAGTCTNQCTQGATRCSGNGLVQTCVNLSSGCTDWALPTACAVGQTCTAATNACAAIPKCTAGDKRCNATAPVVETCDAMGNWSATQTCPQACSAGACTTAAACTPGNVRCNGINVETCNGSGTAWLFTQGCNVACNGGVCADPCSAGQKRCNGKTPESCNAGGTGWSSGTQCATDCYLGACIQADLIIDGTTQVLEGDLKFQNSVVIKNGGQLKVGPTGELKLQAASIHVDASSNINADNVGDGVAGTTTVQVYSHCHDTTICCNGASHVNTTVTCQGSQQPSACSYGNPCAGQTAPSTMRADDMIVTEGATYGSAKGGGAVRLIARTIDLQGQLTANSNTGTYGYGGGVLLAADTINGAGALQATGYYQGMVKLLRGSTDGFTGSVTGSSARSVMPPLDLVSGSHPDSNKVYNDGLGDVFLAWSRPFSSVNGYYYLVSNSATVLPSQAAGQGTFIQGESFKVKAEDLYYSTNYFHIVSVDSQFRVGTVKSSFKVNINFSPPNVNSSSHPSQGTWYQNNAVYLSWTDPAPDHNFTGYYYAFDHYADTVPTAGTTNFTDLKQILLANTQPGIWVFHLISRDTRGAVTTSAQHYKVFVGEQPDVENVSGSVFDASNGSAPLSGATITVNRGLLNATSNGTGNYTFNGQVWEGTWELTAKRTGYLPQTKTITVVKGQPLSVNFSLTEAP